MFFYFDAGYPYFIELPELSNSASLFKLLQKNKTRKMEMFKKILSVNLSIGRRCKWYQELKAQTLRPRDIRPEILVEKMRNSVSYGGTSLPAFYIRLKRRFVKLIV
jgi:hypothetical protein